MLSTGSDPVADFMRFAEEQSMLTSFESISLGQGQGGKAEKMIREGMQKGTLVFSIFKLVIYLNVVFFLGTWVLL